MSDLCHAKRKLPLGHPRLAASQRGRRLPSRRPPAATARRDLTPAAGLIASAATAARPPVLLLPQRFQHALLLPQLRF